MTQLSPKPRSAAERLIVAADFKLPDTFSGNPRAWAEDKLSRLVNSLADLGVYIKMNSILRLLAYEIIEQIHSRGLKVFADLKLFDISETLTNDGAFLRYYKPDLLTVAAPSGVKAMNALAAELPDTEILGVGALTSLDDDDCKAMFSCTTIEAVRRFSVLAQESNLGGLIMSGKECEVLHAEFGLLMSINTPAIRPEWALVKGDDQNQARVMTAAKAIKAGADRIVVGRPITQAENPREAVLRTIEEIDRAMQQAAAG